MQQAEGKGDQPRLLRSQAWLATPVPDNLTGKQDDAQRDRGLDWRTRDVHDPEGRG